MKRIRALAPALALLVLLACGGGPPDTSPVGVHAGLNLLLLTVDTLRPDHLGCYGYPRDTSPAIDGLAARGVRFDNAFTYWPKTRGSFAALFTSRYASQHGLNVRDRDLPEFNETLAEILKANGYRTAAAVDNGNLDRALGFAQGFDRYEQAWLAADTEAERTERLTRFGVDFLKQSGERPFFLWVHYVNPHTPYDPPEEILNRFRSDGRIARGPELAPVVGYHGGVNRHLMVPGETRLGDYIDRYDGEIAFADRALGRLLEALEATPERSRTLVVLTSDHGESLGEHDYFFDHGSDLFQPSLRVPLIIALPDVLSDGSAVGAPVSTLDILPTILDLLQLRFPAGLEGSSLLPLVRGSKERIRDRLFFQNDQHQMAVSNGRLKLISYPEGEGERRYELYDLSRDPEELRDRFPGARRAAQPLVAELESFRTRAVAWQQETTRLRQGKPARSDEDLSQETLRNLETLGYLGGGKPKEEKEKKKRP
jgi:arylsulfatase A-like enzyme